MLMTVAIIIELSGRGAGDAQNVEGGTRTRCHQNILERAESSARGDGGKHEVGLSTGGDSRKHDWRAQLWGGLFVQAGSQTV